MKKVISVIFAFLIIFFAISVTASCVDSKEREDNGDIKSFENAFIPDEIFDENFDDFSASDDLLPSEEKYIEETVKKALNDTGIIIALAVTSVSLVFSVPIFVVLIIFIVLNSKAKKKLAEYNRMQFTYGGYSGNINNGKISGGFNPVNGTNVPKVEFSDGGCKNE